MSMISELSTIFEDRLPNTFRAASMPIFPLLERADRTVEGVKMVDGNPSDLSRLYAVKHGWDIGSAGMLRSTSPYGPEALDVGTEARIGASSVNDSNLAPIPPAAESPYPGDFVRTLYLHANVGNVGLPVTWQFSDALDAVKLKMLARIMKTCGEKTRRQDAISYSSYRATNSAGYKTTVLSRATSISKATHSLRAGTTNANFVDIVIDERYGTIANFHEGDEIDIVANSGGAAGTAGTLQSGTATDATDIRNYDSAAVYIQLVVTKVDRLSNTITCIGIKRYGTTDTADAIAAFSDTTGWQGTTGCEAYDWICPRGASTYTAATRPWLTNGLEDWVAASGRIMGGAQYSQALDLDEYPMFKSLVRSNLAGPLTEDTLDSFCAAAGERFPNLNINAFVTTRGVLLKFKQELQSNTTSQFDRTNLPFKVKGGWTLSNYVTPEGSYEWWTSPYCLKNTMYGQQIDPSNLKLYSHKLLGTSKENFAEGIQFLGQLLGYPTARVPEVSSNGTVKMVVGMPWVRFALLCPINPQGFKIGGITETELLDALD